MKHLSRLVCEMDKNIQKKEPLQKTLVTLFFRNGKNNTSLSFSLIQLTDINWIPAVVKALCEKYSRTVSSCPQPWVSCGMGGTQTKSHGVCRIKELFWATVTWGDSMEGVDFKLGLRNG